MFSNCNLLSKISKFRGYKFQSGLDALFCYCGVKTFRYLNSPKLTLFDREGNNGFKILQRKYPETENESKSMSEISSGRCWKCKQVLEIKDFNCSSCGALQYPRPDINFFQLLGVSQAYDIDMEDLSTKFKNLQMLFHPDKFVNKSKEELQISEAYSRLINKAYTTLKNPVSRGYYLLELQKIPTESYTLQQDFLMKIMDKNEELESIDKPNELAKFMRHNNEEILKQINLIKEAFRSNQLESAKMNLLKLNYYVNLDNKVKEKQSPSNPSPATK